jgi:hypothetical protein
MARDPCDRLMESPAAIASGLHQLLSLSVTGRLRWYGMSMCLGALLVLTLLLIV